MEFFNIEYFAIGLIAGILLRNAINIITKWKEKQRNS